MRETLAAVFLIWFIVALLFPINAGKELGEAYGKFSRAFEAAYQANH